MTLPAKIHRREASAYGGAGASGTSLGAMLTTSLLGVILVVGPLLAGAGKAWFGPALLGAVVVLVVVQGVRLVAGAAARTSRRIDAIDLSVLAFLAYAAVRWLTSPAEYISRRELMLVFACAGIFFTCRYGTANRKYCMLLFYFLVGIGTAEAAAGFYLSQNPGGFGGLTPGASGPQEVVRWMGTYESPNHFASFLVMTMAAALALGGFSKLAWPVRIIIIYAALVMTVGIIWSGSRGGWIALATALAGLVVMGIRNSSMPWWWPVAAGSVMAAVALVFFGLAPVVQDRLQQSSAALFGGGHTGEPRYELALRSIHIARDHLAFGTGPATFEFVYPRYRPAPSDFYVVNSHNDYLNCLDDYGAVGLGLCLFFIAAVTLKFFRPLDVDNRWQDRTLVATGFAVWLALLAHSFVDYNLHVPANALLFFALVGMALGRYRRETHLTSLPLARLGPWPGIAVVVASLACGVVLARATAGSVFLQRAHDDMTAVPVRETIRTVEQSLQADPGNDSALKFLGDLYRYQAAHETDLAAATTDRLKALAAYEAGYRANTLDDVLQERVGIGLDLIGKFDEAMPHLQAALAAEPSNGRFWQALSDHDAALGLANAADEEHKKARKCPFGTYDVSFADRDLHGLPGSGEKPIARPAPAPDTLPVFSAGPQPAIPPMPKPTKLPPSPPDPFPAVRSLLAPKPPPPDVVTIPPADHPESQDTKLPPVVLPPDDTSK